MNLKHDNKLSFTQYVFCCLTLLTLCGPLSAEAENESEEEREESHIKLTQEQIELSDIVLQKAAPGNIRELLPVYGMIATNAERIQSVSARYDGVIRDVTKRIGDHVRKGEILVTIEANDSLNAYTIVSSLNGVITQRTANIGEQTADRILFVVEDHSTLWVELALFPKDLAKANVGQKVRINNVDATQVADGQIGYIAPFGDNANQSTNARVLIDNPQGFWRPGQFVSADIILAEVKAPVVVRNEALQIVEGETVIFLQSEQGFEPQAIILGRSDNESSEVISGLKVNDTYVSKNSFILKAELGKGDIEDDD